MTCLESSYGTIFGDETLASIPVGYGAFETWKVLLQKKDLETVGTKGVIRLELAAMRKLRRGKVKSNPRYWDEVMSATQANNILLKINDLPDWALKCMLMKKNKNGKVINKMTKEVIGFQAIDVFFCECYRVVKKLSRTYNISDRTKLDLSYTHPFRLSDAHLSMKSDLRFWRLIHDGHETFKSVAGYSQEWSEIQMLPPQIFCTEIEYTAFTNKDC